MILADKIINLRRKAGWSQEDLAEKIGVSRQSISKWEGALSIPDMNKILKIAEVFNVTTDYLLKDEIENLEEHIQPQGNARSEQDLNVKIVSVETANEYLEYKRKYAFPFSLAVSICIISPMLLILLAGLGSFGKIALTEEQGGIIGVVALLFLIGIAASIFVFIDLKGSKFEFLEREAIETEYGVSSLIKEKKSSYEARHSIEMISGIFLCIVSSTPVIFFALVAEKWNEFYAIIAVDMLLFIVAVGVLLIVHTSVIWNSFEALLEEGDFSRGTKKLNGVVGQVYWGIVTILYLGISFLTHRWDVSWIIWVIAGLLSGLIKAVYDSIYRK